MKTGALRDVKAKLSDYIQKSQSDYLLITRHGKPSALVLGVEGHDLEDVFYMTSVPFWNRIKNRRNEKSIPWKKVRGG